jgi:hypothetical protein
MKTMASKLARDTQPCVFAVRSRTVAKVDRVGGPDMHPVLGRKVIEGSQRLPILDQACHCLWILRLVVDDEMVKRALRFFPAGEDLKLFCSRLLNLNPAVDRPFFSPFAN